MPPSRRLGDFRFTNMLELILHRRFSGEEYTIASQTVGRAGIQQNTDSQGKHQTRQFRLYPCKRKQNEK
jgi:hypothetical protein